MRTPGADFELAAGFLYGEGIVSSRDEIEKISYCVDSDVDAEQRYNIVNVELRGNREYDLRSWSATSTPRAPAACAARRAWSSWSCAAARSWGRGPRSPPGRSTSCRGSSGRRRGLFEATGGLHAAALFDSNGNLLALREDVGRHNATDKLVGWALLGGKLPLSENIVMVSGRSSFEILQKCLTAGAPIVCAVSARAASPSTSPGSSA
jgi:FdhD protein